MIAFFMDISGWAIGEGSTAVFSEFIKICLFIDSILYTFIAWLFGFIFDIASSDFALSELVNTITNRIYIVVGVFALFLMAYALIKNLFDPSGALKGKNSVTNIVKNLIIAIALVALMPTLFTMLFKFQNIIVENNVIGSVVLGTNTDLGLNWYDTTEGKEYPIPITPETVGYTTFVKITSHKMAFDTFNSFFYVDEGKEDEILIVNASNVIGSVASLANDIKNIFNPIVGITGAAMKVTSAGMAIDSFIGNVNPLDGDGLKTFNDFRLNTIFNGNFFDLNTLYYYVTLDNTNTKTFNNIHYIPVVSTVVGIVMIGLLASFCINLIIRMFNLFLLELISPIASFSMIIPNSKVFDTWLKAVFKEYFDLFIRLFSINLAILIFSQYNQFANQLLKSFSTTRILCNIFFIIALLIFINEAPKLVKDIFGIKDDKKGIKDRIMAGTVGSVLGGAAGLISGTVTGAAVAGAGITSAVTNKKDGNWKKALNASTGAFRGLQAGKNASKSKKLSFNEMATNIDKGIKNIDQDQKKSADRADKARKEMQREAAKGNSIGYAEALARTYRQDATDYFTRRNPSATLEEYEKNKVHSKMKAKNDDLNSAVLRKSVGTKNDPDVVLPSGRTVAANTTVEQMQLKEEAAKTAYTSALSGDSKLITKLVSESDWVRNFVSPTIERHKQIKIDQRDSLLRQLDSLDSASSTYNVEKNKINQEITKYDDEINKLNEDINSILTYADKVESGTNNSIDISNFANLGNKYTDVNFDYDIFKTGIEQKNDQIKAELKEKYENAKTDTKMYRSVVINANKDSDSVSSKLNEALAVLAKANTVNNSYLDEIIINMRENGIIKKDPNTGKNIKISLNDLEFDDGNGNRVKFDQMFKGGIKDPNFIDYLKNDNVLLNDILAGLEDRENKVNNSDEYRNALERSRDSK